MVISAEALDKVQLFFFSRITALKKIRTYLKYHNLYMTKIIANTVLIYWGVIMRESPLKSRMIQDSSLFLLLLNTVLEISVRT